MGLLHAHHATRAINALRVQRILHLRDRNVPSDLIVTQPLLLPTVLPVRMVLQKQVKVRLKLVQRVMLDFIVPSLVLQREPSLFVLKVVIVLLVRSFPSSVLREHAVKMLASPPQRLVKLVLRVGIVTETGTVLVPFARRVTTAQRVRTITGAFLVRLERFQ